MTIPRDSLPHKHESLSLRLVSTLIKIFSVIFTIYWIGLVCAVVIVNALVFTTLDLALDTFGGIPVFVSDCAWRNKTCYKAYSQVNENK